jgi:hypothetical protein
MTCHCACVTASHCVTAPANSLEASLILVAWQGGRESTVASDQSLRLGKDKHMCHRKYVCKEEEKKNLTSGLKRLDRYAYV